MFKNKDIVKSLIVLLILALILTSVVMIFSTIPNNLENIFFIFERPKVFFINFIGVFILLLFFYFLTNRIWISFFISGIAFMLLAFVNYIKVFYRSEPLIFDDLLLIKESMEMQSEYSIMPTTPMIIIFVLFVIGVIYLKRKQNIQLKNKITRLGATVAVLGIAIFTVQQLYFSNTVYAQVGTEYLDNEFSHVDNYMSRGVVYPFIKSMKGAVFNKPDGYNEKVAKTLLDQYEDTDIPKDKQVHFVSIMLEAYADFSEFEELEFNRDPYTYLYELKSKSLSGHLVDNVFGGGTINTELSYLTGYNNHKNYRKRTNSYVWYFKDQGYDAYGMHPSYDWFYNRKNIYPYVGMDNFYNLENYFEPKDINGYQDNELFHSIKNEFDYRLKNSNAPQFSFTVSYQNHGPYADEYVENHNYVKNPGNVSDTSMNLINNYLAGIENTTHNLKQLVDYFDTLDEPVVFVIFGDHKPWLGEDDLGYTEFGINMDVDSEDGFLNYYETPFIIYGNAEAKRVLDRDFVGELDEISPYYLMNTIFEYIGFKGDQYNQYLTDLKQYFTVANPIYYKVDGRYTRNLSEKEQDIYQDFKCVEYYNFNHFKYGD